MDEKCLKRDRRLGHQKLGHRMYPPGPAPGPPGKFYLPMQCMATVYLNIVTLCPGRPDSR
jgi:hypothetical protein